MKRLFLLLCLLIGGVTVVVAQQDADPDEAQKQEKIRALYVAYITKELNLTAEEAQKFWPEHTEFDREMRKVPNDMPELDKQQALLSIKKKYNDRFIRILGPSRTDRFFRQDGEFRRKLVIRMQRARQNRQNTPPRMRRG
jgi:hypothetical protein